MMFYRINVGIAVMFLPDFLDYVANLKYIYLLVSNFRHNYIL